MKREQYVYWIIVFLSMFLYLQIRHSYMFYFMEEQQLFLFTQDYAYNVIMRPGGIALYLSRFMTQFYLLPYVGPLLLSLLVTGIGISVQSIILQINKSEALSAGLASIPMLLLLILHFDICYIAQGTFAFLLMLLLCYAYLLRAPKISPVNRTIMGTIICALIYFIAGAVCVLGCLCMVLCDILLKRKKCYFSFIYPLFVGSLGYLCLRYTLIGSFGEAYFADMYYDHIFHPMKLLYPWYALLICITTSWLTFKLNGLFYKRRRLLYLFPLSVFVLFGFIDKNFMYNDMIRYNIKQDYYLRNKQWDKIIKTFPQQKKDTGNIQTINVLNFALEEKNILCDSLFAYPQWGPRTLLTSWDNSTIGAMTLSDIYYGIGDIAMAQKLAFEGNVGSLNGGNVRLLQRLVETNIIYGAYKVADKYIEILRHTLFYRQWALKYSRFINNDEAVMCDSILGNKRLTFGDGLYMATASSSIVEMLKKLIQNNPQNYAAIQYLAAYYLLEKDAEGVQNFIDKYYGTEIMPSLPIALQEAVLIMRPNDEKYIMHYDIKTIIEYRFRNFAADYSSCRNGTETYKNFTNLYEKTYWYYMLTYNNK